MNLIPDFYRQWQHKRAQKKQKQATFEANVQRYIADLETTPQTKEFVKTQDVTLSRLSWFMRPNHIEASIGDERKRGILLVRDNALKDPHFVSQIELRKMSLLGRNWDLVAASDDPFDVEARDFVQHCFDTMEGTIHNAMDASLDAISEGFSVAEEKWELIEDPSSPWNGKYRLQALKDKDQEHFRFKQDGFGNLDPNEGVMYINNNLRIEDAFPPNKFFIFTFQKRRDSFYGNGLGFYLSWTIFFKKAIMRSLNMFLQRFGNPIVQGVYPDNTDPTTRANFETSIDNLSNQSTISHPRGPEGQEFEIKLIEAARQGEAGFVMALEYYDSQTSKRINGGVLGSDSGRRGARSLGQIHQENRNTIARFDGFQFEHALESQSIERIVRFNFPPHVNPPKLKFRSIDVMSRSDFLDMIEKAHAIGLDIDREYVYEVSQIRSPETEEDRLVPADKMSGTSDPRSPESRMEKVAAQNFKEISFDDLSVWERHADLTGLDRIHKQILVASSHLGAQAMVKVRESIKQKVKEKFVSRRGKIKPTTQNIKFSINVAPLRSVVLDMQVTSWLWGALTATENLEALGFRFPANKFAKFEEEDGVWIDPATDPKSVVPSQAQSLKGFSGRIPISKAQLNSVIARLKQTSFVAAGQIQKFLEIELSDPLIRLIQNPELGAEAYESMVDEVLLDYTGASVGDMEIIRDNPDLVAVFRDIIMGALNQGRFDIYRDAQVSDFIGGLQFTAALNSEGNRIANLNDGKIFTIDNERWTWLIPPVDVGDRSTFVAVPASAQAKIDPEPMPDPKPNFGIGSLVGIKTGNQDE